MKITVKNYRGIESAEITAAPLALVAGNNGSGKSSIAMAVAAVLTRSATPPGMLKKDAGQLLREGQSRGSCEIDGAKISWPGGTVNADTGTPQATAVAAGTSSPLDMKPAETAAYLSGLLNAEPTVDDLFEELEGMPCDLINNVWQEIQSSGWDSAHKRAKESGARIKGQWEQITGEVYGSKKAAEWRPACFADALPDADELQAAVSAARHAVETTVAQAAVSGERIALLQESVQEGHLSGQRIGGLEQQLAEQTAAIDAARKVLETLPGEVGHEQTAACPCCNELLVVMSATVLIKANQQADPSENERRRAARQQQIALINGMTTRQREIQGELWQAQQSAQAGEKAAAELSATRTDGASAEQIEAAREALADAEYRLMAFNGMQEAARKVKQLAQNVLIVSALAADGLRQSVLSRVLDVVNAELEAMAAHSGWGSVTITNEMAVQYRGRDYRLLSASEQFRCRVTLQLYIAQRDGSGAVVIDAADILDRGGRNGLFKMLRGYPLPAVVCMTLNAPEDAPNLKKAGIGRAYWVADHTAVEL